MALKKITESPRVTDSILFEIEAPGADGCFTANPYKVDQLIIYYVQRNFLGVNYGEYEKVIYNEKLVEQVKQAEAAACADPTDANIFAAQQLRNELESTAQKTTFYYNDASPVLVVGDAMNPAWLSTDTQNASLVNIATDADGAPQYGRFQYTWRPQGEVREGDYFACWTWTPNPAGTTLSSHVNFSLLGDPRAVITIPSHMTPPEKYRTILDRYLPDMYKNYLSRDDKTPETLDKFNRAVADGFKLMEDLANQLIDLYDANALHESMLVYLANLFNLKLKSNDPTLWRRQIKEAVRLFKKKGTLQGLVEAFGQAGMTLNKLTRLWQVVSPYTWQESFRVKDLDKLTFQLKKQIFDENDFELWLRDADGTTYNSVNTDNVSFSTSDCGFFSTMTWDGNPLAVGDIIRILYKYREVPAGEQAVEEYIQSLSLADQRDEADQEYPPKNWNVRLIEEDDPLFDLVIPVRHPFHDPLVFGHIRTEFPYSENIYNMEEYNGSTRESLDPCHIDKDFLDPCGGGISSKYNIDLSVQELSDDRIAEIRDILREYTPFHSVVHRINFQGEVNEFIPAPVEEIEMLVKYNFMEYVLSGNANPFFHRVMEDGTNLWRVNRDQLAHQNTVVNNKTATAYNKSISLVAPAVNLSILGVIPDHHILQVLSPSPNAGTYTLGVVNGHIAPVKTTVVEPLNQSMFTFRLSNVVYGNTYSKIYQDDVFRFSDVEVDFTVMGVKGTWDVENVPDYTGGAWSIDIPAYSGSPYTINQVLPDGTLLIEDPGRTLPTTANTPGISYTLQDDASEEKATSITGVLATDRRGRVDPNDGGIVDIHDFVHVLDYMLYTGTEYKVSKIETSTGHFYIDGYTGGDAVGVTIQIRRRLVDNAIGYFGYAGLKLLTSFNHESELGMLNGKNPPYTDPNDITDNSMWKENFMFFIGGEYYKIADIDGNDVTLEGLPQDWGTLNAGGTLVNYNILRFIEDTVETQFVVFDQLDRSGKDPVVREIYSTITQDVAVVALQSPGDSDIRDNVAQDEGVSFHIQWKNGTSEKGDIV